MANDIELTVPNLTTQGPDYATQISNDLSTIATHNHDGVNNGTTIDIAAQDCNEDLSIVHHNLSNVRSVEFDNEPAQLTGSQDVLCLYVNQGNLGFNNDDGIFIPITDGNSLAPSSVSTLNWIMRSNGTPLTSNASILYTDLYNFIALNSTSGSFTVTLPIAAQITPQAIGRLYVFRDVAESCGTHPVTIQVAPGSGNFFANQSAGSTSFIINNAGGYVAIYTDGVSQWFVWSQSIYNTEVLQLNNASFLNMNGSTQHVADSSSIAVDSTSFVTVTGGGLNVTSAGSLLVNGGSSATFNGATVNVNGGTAVSWTGSSTTDTRGTGTSTTFQSGSTLALAAGSTTNAAGTMNLSGTSSLTGTFNVSGGTLSGTANVSLTTNLGSLLTSNGFISHSGTIGQTTVLNYPANTNYTVDSNGPGPDLFLILNQVNGGSVFDIALPSSPQQGRILWIKSGIALNTITGTQNVVIGGSGHTVMNGSSFSLAYTSYSGGSVVSWSLGLIYNGGNWDAFSALNLVGI